MSNKALIRIGSLGLAIMMVLLAIAVYNKMEAHRYRRQVENNHIWTLQEISSQINAITVDLKKGSYAGTPVQLSAAAAQVWKSASAAKGALGSLPVADQPELEETYRFLSQVGDYCMYLSRKAMLGEDITDEERKSLDALKNYAATLNDQITDLEYRIASGQAALGELLDGELAQTLVVPVTVRASIDLDGLEQQPEGYPTLIYDGPFSDHLLEQSPVMTEGLPQLSPYQAARQAASFADLSVSQLDRGSDEDSHMPSYSFTSGDVEVGVTTQGGLVTYLVSGREIGPRRLDIDAGRESARRYLELRGIGSMRETYYELAGGILTVNYAYTQEDTICYTDLIKVGVAMDDGQVVFYDARGFINNHRERDLPPPVLTAGEAREVVSSVLRPRKVQMALIPTAGNDEALCYEFLCDGSDGEHVLVYINALTGGEEQILILIESETGTLTI